MAMYNILLRYIVSAIDEEDALRKLVRHQVDPVFHRLQNEVVRHPEVKFINLHIETAAPMERKNHGNDKTSQD